MTITPEQRCTADAAGAVLVTDPETNGSYYLVREEVYDRLRGVLDDGPDMREVGLLVEAAMREDDAGDSLLDSYQKFRR